MTVRSLAGSTEHFLAFNLVAWQLHSSDKTPGKCLIVPLLLLVVELISPWGKLS